MTDRATQVYTQCGMALRSEIPLDLTASTDTPWDVDVRLGPETNDSWLPPSGEVVAAYGDDDLRWYTATTTTDGYLIRFPGCGDFIVSADISNVVVCAQRDGRSDLLSILLAGTMSAFLASLRGTTVLHASAVTVGDTAVAFVGNSGQGKSTMAALMCVEGAALVADDVLAVEPGYTPACRGGASALRLRAAAAHLADAQPDRALRVTEDDRRAFSARVAPSGPHPLGAIVIPSPSESATHVQLSAIEPSDAVVRLMSMPRIVGWRHRDVITRDFATLGQIANRVPIYAATIPWGPPFDRGIARDVADLVAGRRE